MKTFAEWLLIIGMLPAMAWSQVDAEQPDEATEDMAWIVTMQEKPVQCLSSVAIQKIDGREKIVSPMGFSIEPGMHSMNGRAKVNTAYCRPIRGYRSEPVPPLEAEFEAGKTYYVGFDHSSTNRREWALVIWKIEDRIFEH